MVREPDPLWGSININKLSAPQQINRCCCPSICGTKPQEESLGLGLGLAIGPVVFAVDHKSDSLGLQQDLAAASREIHTIFWQNFRHSNRLWQLHAVTPFAASSTAVWISVIVDLWHCGQILDRFLSSPVKYSCIIRFILCFSFGSSLGPRSLQ